jgi:hypothetical protein
LWEEETWDVNAFDGEQIGCNRRVSNELDEAAQLGVEVLVSSASITGIGGLCRDVGDQLRDLRRVETIEVMPFVWKMQYNSMSFGFWRLYSVINASSSRRSSMVNPSFLSVSSKPAELIDRDPYKALKSLCLYRW